MCGTNRLSEITLGSERIGFTEYIGFTEFPDILGSCVRGKRRDTGRRNQREEHELELREGQVQEQGKLDGEAKDVTSANEVTKNVKGGRAAEPEVISGLETHVWKEREIRARIWREKIE